jgi:hypothetical protein
MVSSPARGAARFRPFGWFSQTTIEICFHGVVITDKTPHPACHGAGDNLSRHEKMPQIHLSGEFRSHNAGRFDRVDGAILPAEPPSQRLFRLY